jgi:hypothetical protein
MRSILGHGIEDWLEISRRTSNYAKNLAGGRLLVLGLGEFAIAGLELLGDAL